MLLRTEVIQIHVVRATPKGVQETCKGNYYFKLNINLRGICRSARIGTGDNRGQKTNVDQLTTFVHIVSYAKFI